MPWAGRRWPVPAANDFSLEVPSLAENVGLARVCVAAFAGQLPFTLAEVEEIRVAVSEAVSNCVLHAYPDAVGRVRVRGRIEDGALIVEVRDWGRGIEDVERARRPTVTTKPGRMGLGFVFMEAFMDGVTVTSALGDGTQVILRKVPSRAREEG
ncbi:MAG: anti-sigma F factor, partial [Clostridia bacterium]|nr:anti-sigma F factor [Clostridia bacterium]